MSISVVRCKDYSRKDVIESVRRIFCELGGIEKFVNPMERVLVKPNLLGAHPPQQAITTHPEVVRGVVRLIKEAGGVPLIGDSPSTLDIWNVYEKTGIRQIAEEENVELLDFNSYKVVEKSIDHPTIKKIYLSKYVEEVGAIINLPKLKTHSLTVFTCGVKNLYGFVPGLLKTEYHRYAATTKLFNKLLAEIFTILESKVRLTVVDGVVGMDGEGPASGRVRNFGILYGSDDVVEVDIFTAQLFNISPRRIELFRYCKRDFSYDTNEDIVREYKFRDTVLPARHIVNYIPEVFIKFLSPLVWLKPNISNSLCRLCKKCYDICPTKAIKMDGDRLVIDDRDCIKCFCCKEVCNYGAVSVKESLLLKIGRRLI
jgi:uncharacterized protein (DUF362 family)/Pyruvate/2-oxoacid:ferredoxin oxidoreductase delta subunit